MVDSTHYIFKGGKKPDSTLIRWTEYLLKSIELVQEGESVPYQNQQLQSMEKRLSILDNFLAEFANDEEQRIWITKLNDEAYEKLKSIKVGLMSQIHKRKNKRFQQEGALNCALSMIYAYLDNCEIPIMEQCDYIFEVYKIAQYNDCNLEGYFIDTKRRQIVSADDDEDKINRYIKKYPQAVIVEITKESKVKSIHKYRQSLMSK